MWKTNKNSQATWLNRSHCMVPRIFSKCELVNGAKKQISACLGRVGGGKGHEVNVGVTNTRIMITVLGVYICIKMYQTVHFEYVQFIVCPSYHSNTFWKRV